MMRVRKYPALLLVCLMISSLLTVPVSAAEMQPETEISVEETEALLTDAQETETAIQEETEDLIEIETETEIISETETESIPESETEIIPESETESISESETELHPVIEEPLEEETFFDTLSPEDQANYMCRMGSSMKSVNSENAAAAEKLYAASSSDARTRFSKMTRLKVIDVSEWQGTVDWKKVKAAGIQGVFLRAGGRYISGSGTIFSDSNFATNIKGAKAAGLKVGIYFFSQAITNAEAVAEAKYTLKQLSGYKPDLPIFIDYEWNSGGGYRTDNGASVAVRTGIMRAFCETIENAGYETGIYASASWFTSYIDGNALSKEYNIWVAQIGVSFPGYYYTGVFDGWQYSWTGSVNGIEGDVDMDYWYVPTGSYTFKDVYKSSLYYYNPVYWGSDEGITNGYFNKSWFKPADTCTREQMVTFLWRAAGSPEPEYTDWPFTDVSSSAYYYKAVTWAAEQGITKGYSDGTFGVGKECLREHAMTFLWRAAGCPKPASSKSTFSDVKSTAYYYKAVLWGCENEITKGYSNGTFGPSKNCLREHVITFLYRYQNL